MKEAKYFIFLCSKFELSRNEILYHFPLHLHYNVLFNELPLEASVEEIFDILLVSQLFQIKCQFQRQ